jgi:hypothetical protein
MIVSSADKSFPLRHGRFFPSPESAHFTRKWPGSSETQQFQQRPADDASIAVLFDIRSFVNTDPVKIILCRLENRRPA